MSARSSPGLKTQLLTTEEVASRAHAASKKGLKVGKQCFEKCVGRTQGVYTIISIDDTVVLEEADAFKKEKLTVKVAFKSFMDTVFVAPPEHADGCLFRGAVSLPKRVRH